MTTKKPEFEVGDVVRLNSGGPAMTVENIGYGGRQAFCSWFVGNDRRSGSFDTLALDHDEDYADERK